MTHLTAKAVLAGTGGVVALLFAMPVFAGPGVPPVPSVPPAPVPASVGVSGGSLNVGVGPVHQSVPIPQPLASSGQTSTPAKAGSHGAGTPHSAPSSSSKPVAVNSQNAAATRSNSRSLGDSAFAAAALVTNTPGGTPTAAFVLLLLSAFLLIRRATLSGTSAPELRWIR